MDGNLDSIKAKIDNKTYKNSLSDNVVNSEGGAVSSSNILNEKNLNNNNCNVSRESEFFENININEFNSKNFYEKEKDRRFVCFKIFINLEQLEQLKQLEEFCKFFICYEIFKIYEIEREEDERYALQSMTENPPSFDFDK